MNTIKQDIWFFVKITAKQSLLTQQAYRKFRFLVHSLLAHHRPGDSNARIGVMPRLDLRMFQNTPHITETPFENPYIIDKQGFVFPPQWIVGCRNSSDACEHAIAREVPLDSSDVIPATIFMGMWERIRCGEYVSEDTLRFVCFTKSGYRVSESGSSLRVLW